jgi:hypothetical protein
LPPIFLKGDVMKNSVKRITAVVLAVLIAFSALSVGVSADEENEIIATVRKNLKIVDSVILSVKEATGGILFPWYQKGQIEQSFNNFIAVTDYTFQSAEELINFWIDSLTDLNIKNILNNVKDLIVNNIVRLSDLLKLFNKTTGVEDNNVNLYNPPFTPEFIEGDIICQGYIWHNSLKNPHYGDYGNVLLIGCIGENGEMQTLNFNCRLDSLNDNRANYHALLNGDIVRYFSSYNGGSVGINLCYNKINGPSEKYPYGYLIVVYGITGYETLINVAFEQEDGTRRIYGITPNSFSYYIPFKSMLEYNAAVNLDPIPDNSSVPFEYPEWISEIIGQTESGEDPEINIDFDEEGNIRITVINNTENNTDLSGVIKAILDLPVTLVKLLLDGLKALFIPKENFFSDFLADCYEKFNGKIPIFKQVKDLFGDFIGIISKTYDEPPILNIDVNGVKVSIIDFSVYADYRPFIHGLIIAFSYFFFIRKTVKRIPKMLGGIT